MNDDASEILPPRDLVHWLRPLITLHDDSIEPLLRRIRRRYATPRAAGEFRFLVQSASQPAMLAALRETLSISYVDNPEYFQLAAEVEQRAAELDDR